MKDLHTVFIQAKTKEQTEYLFIAMTIVGLSPKLSLLFADPSFSKEPVSITFAPEDVVKLIPEGVKGKFKGIEEDISVKTFAPGEINLNDTFLFKTLESFIASK